MGGQVGMADNAVVEEGAMIGAQSGILKEVGAGEAVWGTPSRPLYRQSARCGARLAYQELQIGLKGP